MDKKKRKELQSTISKELKALEDDVRRQAAPQNELDELFDLLFKKLESKYKSLKEEQSSGPSVSSMLEEIEKLKRDTATTDSSKLKGVYSRMTQLKQEVIFGFCPPQIDADELLCAIDHLGNGSDSEQSEPEEALTEREPYRPPYRTPQEAPQEAPYRTAPQEVSYRAPLKPESSRRPKKEGPSSGSYKRTLSDEGRYHQDAYKTDRAPLDPSAAFSRKPSQSSERPFGSQRGSDRRVDAYDRQSSRGSEFGTQSSRQLDEVEIKSVSSHSGSDRRKADSGAPLLGPGAFASSAQSRKIELRDDSLTPERRPKARQSMDDSRTPVREPAPVTPASSTRIPHANTTSLTHDDPLHRPNSFRAPPQRSVEKTFSVPTLPPPSLGPRIEDLCLNKKIKRYFFAFTEFTDPTVDTWCTVSELYNPTKLFVQSENIEHKREKIQTDIHYYVSSCDRMTSKSHPLGKLVLATFGEGRNLEWYRACIIQSHQNHEYTLLFMDYGNTHRCSYTNMYEMPEILQHEVMCVQQCYLAGVGTPNGEDTWNDDTKEAVWDLVRSKRLKITVSESKSQVYGVVLEFEAGGHLVNINDKLVEMGLAVLTKDKEGAMQMDGMCTSPTRFVPTPRASEPRPSSQTSRSAPRRISPPARRISPPARRGAPPSSSSDDSSPGTGRPPSFGKVQQAPFGGVAINSPAGGGFVFGDRAAKGRGDVFRQSEGGTTTYPGDIEKNDDVKSSDKGDATNSSVDEAREERVSRRSEVRFGEGEKWSRDGFKELEDELPPPNFVVTHKDLLETAAILRETDRDEPLTPRDGLKTEAQPSNTTQMAPTSDYSNARSRSESIIVISEGHASPISNQEDPTGGMEGLETDYIPNPAPPTEPDTKLSLRQIYDPQSYLLGDLTLETVYREYKGCELTKLPIEQIRGDTYLAPVLVTHVESPELFCVSLLRSRNLNVLNALNASLTVLYSDKTDWKVGDRTTKRSGGSTLEGTVVALNRNLLQIQWTGTEDAKWENCEQVEKKAQLLDLLKSGLCKVEFEKGDFCAAKYSFSDASNVTSSAWYRAMVIEVLRKRSTKKVFKYVVLYVDYGNVEEVQVKCVRPLPAHFLALPAQSIPCFLPEIRPKPADSLALLDEPDLESDEEEDEEVVYRGQYDKEAATAFRDLILNERVYVSVVEGDTAPLHYGYRRDLSQDKDSDTLLQFRNSSLPVTLGDRVKNELVSLAQEFANSGHAELIFDLGRGVYPTEETGPVSSSVIEDGISRLQHQLDNIEAGRDSPISIPTLHSELSSDLDSDTLSTFDPMSEDFSSETNLVDHDRDDVGTAVYGQKLSKRTLCRFFSRGRRCYKGDQCRFLHQKKSDFHSEQSERAIAVDNKPPTPTNDMPIIVQVTAVVSPFHFWAQILPHDISPGDIEMNDEVEDPLSALTRKMDAMYRIQGYRECKYYPAIGEIVAVKSRLGNGSFRRARVTETDEVGEGKCRVFHLDYGLSEVVPEKSLRIMEPVFIKEMPFHAQEMFLADVRAGYPVDPEPVFVAGEQVARDEEAAAARDFFLKLVSDKWMVAKVIEKTPEGSLRVHLWDTSTENWTSVNKQLVERGFAESLHPLPDELTTDCGTLASSSFQIHTD